VDLYRLRQWARLACKGNPSVLHFFFAKPRFAHPLWSRLWEQRSLFFARNHVEQFLDYAEAQVKRLYNERSKDVNRALPSPDAPQAHIFFACKPNMATFF
jgi:hypothetical protein